MQLSAKASSNNVIVDYASSRQFSSPIIGTFPSAMQMAIGAFRARQCEFVVAPIAGDLLPAPTA
jgi:hypothetical protein